MTRNIYVLCGGKSVEHEISLKSASAILNALDKDKYNIYPIFITKEGQWVNCGLLKDEINQPSDLEKKSTDLVGKSIGRFLFEDLKEDEENIVFPALHGSNGEDGTIQGLLELLNIPYVGNEVLSSSLAMDKAMTKDVFHKHNIPQTKHLVFKKFDYLENKDLNNKDIAKEVGFPCYIKPSNSGSSVGIHRVENMEDLQDAIDDAFLYDVKIVVEAEVKGREMQISVIGNNHPKASLPGEFILERPFFDYNAKYIDGKLIPVVPANLSPELTDQVREMAVRAYKVLDCRGLARVDIFVTDDNEILVNEVNTMPGFTSVSMTPVLWKATNDTSYSELVEELIQFALDRFKEKQALIRTRC